MFAKTSAVVELGASHVALGLFQRSARGRLQLVDCEAERIGSDEIFEPAWRENVATALRTLRVKTGITGAVTVVLPPHLTLTKFIRVPRLEKSKREQVIQFEAQQALPVALSDLVWDSSVAWETGGETEVMLSAVKRENIDALYATIEAAGFAVRRMIPVMSALLAGYRLVQAPNSGSTLLFDIGARSVVLLLIESHRFCGRAFALGGPAAVDQLTMEILALRLKQEATRTLVHFGRLTASAQPTRIVLTGGGAQVNGLAAALAGKFALPFELLEASRAVEARRNVTGQARYLAHLAGAAAVGILPNQSAIDLRPAQQRRQEAGRRRRLWLAAAGAVVALALLPPLFHFRTLAAVATRKATALERELAPLRTREALNRANLQKLAETKQQIAQLQRIDEARSQWAGFLADLQNRLGEVEDVWFERVKVLPLAPADAHAPAAPRAPLRLAFTGRMLDRANPLSKVSDDTYRRVRQLLASIAGSPFVTSIQTERFDHTRPGVLRFDFVVAAKNDGGF